MLFKIATLFLVAMAVLAMFGRLRFPGALRRRLPGKPGTLTKPVPCRKCGRYSIGPGPCDCTKPPANKG
ncbi:MAG: hypothetical protein Q8O82_12885 [Pseudorhodobacter sp.]|nr:hypothetical protein [Pseudorhodobacter sp.]